MMHIEMNGTRGFTLIEIMVVVGILGLLAGAFAVNNENLDDRAQLRASASRILEAVKDTRQRSLSVDEFVNEVFPSYGLHFDINDPQQVTVYADCTADDSGNGLLGDEDEFAFDEDSNDCDGDNGFVESVPLQDNTQISQITATGAMPDEWASSSPQSRMDILYLRPEPTVWITNEDGDLMSTGQFEITLATDNNATTSIVFSITGSTYIKSN